MTPELKPGLVYILKRIKVHLEPDLAEAAFRPNEAMEDAITDLTEALARLKALEEECRALHPKGLDSWTVSLIDEWADEIAAIRGKLEGK